MMRARLGILAVLLGLMALASGCASSRAEGFARQGYDFTRISSVAIVGVTGEIYGEAAKAQITDYFNQQLLRRGYSPIERQQIQQILNEQDFQASDVTGTAGAARIGRVINVDAAILVNIPRFQEKLSMTARMVDVEDASILWSASGSGRTGKNLSRAAGALIGAAGGAAAGAAASDGQSGITILSGAAGAAAGGLAGEAMTPQREEQARRVIEKLAESLPAGAPGAGNQ